MSGVDVLAVRWVAEMPIPANGMYEVRAGDAHACERPLVGYFTSYGLAHEIAALHNARIRSAQSTPGDPSIVDVLQQIVAATQKTGHDSCDDCYTAACIANGALARAGVRTAALAKVQQP